MKFYILQPSTWEGLVQCRTNFMQHIKRVIIIATVTPAMPIYTRMCACMPGTLAWLLGISAMLVMFVGGHQGKLEQYGISLFVREDASIGTLVGEVKGDKFSPPYARWISKATVDITLKSFNVDLVTGRITTKGNLDREQQDRHTIIISTSFLSPKLLIIEVRVLDINDFTPVFLNSLVNASISESAPKDHTIPLGSVRDEDLGENATQRVEIISGNDENDFILQIKNNSSVDKILDLVVNYQLDYERTRVYNLVIRATDGGGRFSEMKVVVNILDQNDNEPIFNLSKYSARVGENVPVGVVILQVHATDTDSGENSRIIYSIDHRSDPEEYFTVNATTGWVRVNKPLDYEARERFSLTLQARDNGIPPQMGTSALDIVVEDISEKPANISVDFQPSFSNGHIREDSSVGTLVAIISIDEIDSYLGFDMEVFLFRSEGYFTLKTGDYMGLYVSSRLDREVISEFEMTLQIVGNGNPPLIANKIFKVIIDDVNDNPPVFEKSEYFADVEETAEIGAEVIRVSAADADFGANARIAYHIDESSQNIAWFTVDSTTGVVTTRATLDCTVNRQPVIVIAATDGGDPPRKGSAQVTISVRNVNYKAPEFETSFYSIKVAENRRVGDCILVVSATDPECGINSPVIYRMIQMLAPPKEFRVDTSSGAICIQSGLDFETTSSYEFQVEAVDTDGLSTQAVVQIDVTDVNDNHPRFEPREYSINVLSGVKPGQLVTVQSRDRDSGIFGTVSYSITEGNNKRYFDINTNTGAISLKKSLPEAEGVFDLRILATDGGGMTSPDLALVTVSVISGVVHPPIFTPTIFSFIISEDAGLGQMVGRVQASLDNTGGDMEIMYSSLFQTADWFSVDSRTGCIYTKFKIDRELYPFVVLSVQAQAGFPPVYAVAQVNVTILDVNDNEPYFPATTMLELEVWEDEKSGTALYIARANDLDMGNNGTVRYRLHNNTGDIFAINEYMGEISLIRELDYEYHQEYQLVVIAEDLGTPTRLSSNMTLTLKVRDVNDNSPEFDQAVYDFYVPENVEVGHPVGRVVATDDDSSHNKRISFSLKNSPYSSVFWISSVDGIIWTRDILDREVQEIYEMTIQAVDHGSPIQLSTTSLIRVIVTDVNDNEPVFSRDEYRFSIRENLGPNSLVGQLIAQDLDSGDNGNIHFFFSVPQTSFSINSQNGEIRTQVSLNRELIAEHFLTVYASDKGVNPKTTVTKVRVVVEDNNDNGPTFLTQGPLLLNVSENRPKGTEVTTLVAVDPDVGENSQITYFFDKDHSESAALTNFEIHPKSGKLTTKDVLDYETQSTYHLTVVARDNGQTFHQTLLPVTILVLDADDQAYLHHTQYISFDCVENVSIGTVIGQVTIAGQHSIGNGEVTYYLVGGNVFSSFSVDPTSGMITTVGKVDYEKCSAHSLSIQALDSSSGRSRRLYIRVTINIIDINDSAPVFEQDLVIVKAVPENIPKGHVVHKVTAIDRDSGVNGTVHYSITSCSGAEDNHCPYLDIDRETGELFVSHLIDFEMVDQISVIVKAEDACPYPDHVHYSLMTAVIYVSDLNDNAPEFRSADNLMVSEDEAIGSRIMAVVALDPDSNIDGSGNNVVRYHIVSGNEDGKFLLEPDTGYLSIYDTLDYETKAHHVLNISAEDSGTPRMVAYQYLQVTVTDVNDNSPVFDQPVYYAQVSENGSPHTSIIRIQASDSDTGENGQLTYFIPSGIAEDKFTVDSQTGVVATKVKLDREVKDSYSVTVFVKDAAYPYHCSSSSIIIAVSDQNDHAPVFKNRQYTVQIPENRAQNSVLKLLASDRDLGENARTTYSITSGNDGKFRIGPSTGVLSTEPLDREVTSTYNLTVIAIDHGDDPLTATTYIIVTVLDENDNSPVFVEEVYTASIPEDIKESQLVLTVTAKDPDKDQNGHVIYSLVTEADGHFEINSSTGEIVTSGVFDREKVSIYSFIIMASDNGVTGPRNSTTHVIITITDINDNAPTFSMVPYTASLSLVTPPNTYILTVSASDPDLGNNGLVEYSLQTNATSGEFVEDFYIDGSTGDVYTKNTLFRFSGHYSLSVVATDSATDPGARLSSTGIIEITVGSGDSIRFQFSHPEYRVEIPEHYKEGNSVIIVTATYGSGSEISKATLYSFASGNENKAFRIASRTGQITVADPDLIDYESVHRMCLTVRAVNGNHHAYAKIWINLTDINDNTPKFSQAKYVAAIGENNHPETYVAQVTAKDADSRLNGDVVYSIIGGNADMVFKIPKPYSGTVVTNSEAAPLDREAQPDGYRLTIEARDHGNPSKSSTCVLAISIVDENDTPPFFPDTGPQNVSENVDVGYTITMVTANDVDLNPILVYDFTTDGNPDSTFSLDCFTGRLTLAKQLDYEKKCHYSVGIQVTDGKPDHVRSTWLDVYVIDENDNSPVFLQPSYQASLPEQTGPHHLVITVMATDADSGRNSQVRYIMASTKNESFYINPSTGTIYTSRNVSFKSVIQLVVVAKDNGTTVQSSTVAVHIHVTAINKYSPRFLEAVKYVAHISESAQKGHHVLQVSAVDKGSSHHGDSISYTLIGPGSELFFIHPHTGNIFYNGGIDFEVKKKYDISAVASDRGTPPKNASTPVTIIVDDINDNPPVFMEEKYSITLDENSKPLQVFLTVNTSDADSGMNSAVKFFIMSGNSEGIFVNPNNEGNLIIKEGMNLDYESHPSHRLIIKAIDCNDCPLTLTRLSAFVVVDITVRDISEFKPRFPVKHYMAEVTENSNGGAVVFRAHANDDDGGEMGIVTYSLLNDLDYQKFAVEANSGEVTTKFVFDYETDRVTHLYNLIIIATDGGGNSDMTDVTIQVIDVDEFDPVLAEDEYMFEVPGSAKMGDYVGQVSASDDDGGEAGRLVYTFLEASEYFFINPFTGNITVATTLHDNPATLRYSSNGRKKRALTFDKIDLTIQVTSGQPGSRKGIAACTISINRTCSECAAPFDDMHVTIDVDGGILAGIIVACVIVIVLTIFGILCLVYQHRKSGKSMASYLSDSDVDLEPPGQLGHSRKVHADVVRANFHLSSSHISSDVLDQSPNSASSGWGSEEAENEDYEETSRIKSNVFLHSLQAFCEKAIPDSGIQHDDDILSEQAIQEHQQFYTNLGVDSSKITNNTSFSNSYTNNYNRNQRLVQSAESVHLFCQESEAQAIADANMQEMTSLESESKFPTLEIRAGVMYFPEPNIHSFQHLLNNDEMNGDPSNWDSFVNWSPEYQPLAEVFSEIAKLKDDSIAVKKQPIKTIQNQFSSLLEKPHEQEAAQALLTNSSTLTRQLPYSVFTDHNSDTVEFMQQTSAASARIKSHHSHKHQPYHFTYNDCNFLPCYVQNQISEASHVSLLQPSQASSQDSQNVITCQIHSPHLSLHTCPVACTSLQAHKRYHSALIDTHCQHDLTPSNLPPPLVSQMKQSLSSSISRSNQSSAQISTLKNCLPCSSFTYKSSQTCAVITPSATLSVSPVATTRSPSISQVIISNTITPGNSS